MARDPNQIVLDIPTGNGAFVQRLKDHGFSTIYAMDIVNRLEIDHDDFVAGDMMQPLSLPDASCDTVVCIDGLEHIHRQYDFVQEANRLLKMGGHFIVSTPNVSSLRSRWKWLWTGHHHKCPAPLDERRPSPHHHIGMISFPELRYMLHTNGFTIQAVTTNRIKLVSWLFGLLLPLVYLATVLAYRKEAKREGTADINQDILQTVFSRDILFGETLIVQARKTNPILPTSNNEFSK